jgi:hypothetical protein
MSQSVGHHRYAKGNTVDLQEINISVKPLYIL